jgi:CRP-like cAMP-binding protein
MAPVHPLLVELPPDVLTRLQPESVSLPRGRTLYDLGATVPAVYFVTAGLVSLLALTADGGTLELASIGPDGFLGLPVVLGTRVTPHVATVHIAGAAWRLPTDAFARALQDAPALRRACLQYTDRVLGDISQTAACHHFHTVFQRVCRWLLTTSDRLQTDTLCLTQETLASVLGVPRTSITSVLGELQQADTIRCRTRAITILQRRRLELSSCACYDAGRDAFTLTPPTADVPRPSAVRRRAS